MTTDAPIIDARNVTYSLEVAGRPLHILKGVSLRVAVTTVSGSSVAPDALPSCALPAAGAIAIAAAV